MSDSKQNVKARYHHAYSGKNFLEGGWYVSRGNGQIGGFIGEGETEAEAWDDANAQLLANALEGKDGA